MGKYYKWKVLFIVAITAFCLWRAYPPQEKINLGLDLQGGIQLLLQADLTNFTEKDKSDATDRIVEIIRNRIDELGVREPVISKQGRDYVVVQLPGVTDRQRAREIVGKTAHLEFKLVSDNTELLKDAEAGKVSEDFEYKDTKEDGIGGKLLLSKEAVLTGEHLTNASVGFDQYGQAIVQLQFDSEGGKLFDRATFQNIGKQLAIVLDGVVHSAPVIRDRIPNGQAQISGNFTAQQASDLALILRAGALPAPVHIIEERTVGATLGKDSISSGVNAAIFGMVLVVAFMLVYYLIPGLVANVALLVYAIIVVGAMALIGASLTLPGIAGFILSIGMAVDANVLIFERMREEFRAGKNAKTAVASGYHKAFSAILDSHVTTLLTSLLLFMFGTGPIKGFAVTLSIGIVADMFTAIVVTRVIIDAILKNNPNPNFKMLNFIDVPKIDFLKKRYFAYGFSIITIALGLATFAFRGNHNYGVEFTGGNVVQIGFNKPIEISELRENLGKADVKGLSLQNYGELSQNQFIIRTGESDTRKVESVAEKISGGKNYEVLKVDQIGPTVSKDLTKKALLAVFWSAIGILIYLGWRFEPKFAIAAVIALLHDTLFTWGMYALSGREINLTSIAAILTVMGFSVNDTIVTFDRVRDNLKLMRKTSFSEIVNVSVNQTLGRTIITSLTAILSVLALFFLGGSALNDFAFILLVGFVIGIYSTVFVASALVVDMKARK